MFPLRHCHRKSSAFADGPLYGGLRRPSLKRGTGPGSGTTSDVRESRPRPISTGQLKTLPSLHLRPINLVVSQGSYRTGSVGNLILGWAWRLDAFSAYPLRTWLPSLCPWRDNWYTSGASIPVLSYWGRLPSSFLRLRWIGTELSHDVLNPAHVPL